MINKIFFYLLSIHIITSCSSNESKYEEYQNIEYEIELTKQTISRASSPSLSNFFTNIEYVKLETTDNSLVKGNHRVYISENFIFTIAFRQILQFDRKGNFIKEIGHYGRDPEGYLATLPHVNPLQDDFPVVRTGKHINKIDPADNSIEKIATLVPSIQSFAKLDSNLFVGYNPNTDCKQEYRLILFDENGTIIKKYKNHLSCEKLDQSSFTFDLSEGLFYKKNAETYFKESYNDTIFRIDRDSLIGHAVFNLGEAAIKYEDKEKLTQKERWDKISIYHTFESDKYIFFGFSYKKTSYSGVFDKENQITYTPEKKQDENGIEDDINSFLDFNPISISEQNEVVGLIYPDKVLEWFQQLGKESDIPTSIRQLQNIELEDNPIVAIAKLR